MDEPDSLQRVMASLSDSAPGPVAVDTEANSFHRYFEKVCLLQLAEGGRTHVVDPLAVDIGPLLSLLASRRLLLHGADYDLRMLHRGYGFRAGSIFDTMLAAQLLGEKEIGLSALLTRRVGVSLDKTNQRADWSHRPLTDDLLAYAAGDVLHLEALVDSLRDDLVARGRLGWHEEECARLAAAEFPAREADPEEDWRLKGTNGLTARERAFLRALWQAREERAREIDRPPFRVLTNDRLLQAARLAAAGETDLAVLVPGKPLPGPFATRVRQALREAAALPPAAWPQPRRPEPYLAHPALERAVEKLKKKRDALARTLGLDPGVLASRGLLTAAARASLQNGRLDAEALARATGMSRWRAELLTD